jgi:hypothetical protein
MALPSGHDWREWHDPYDDPSSALSGRLRIVQRFIREALDEAETRPIRVVSACAGEGRDLLGVLDDHPRRADVRARLVEMDPVIAGAARRAAAAAQLTGVDVVTGDASSSSVYAGAIPADLVLMCGIFGNVADDDVRRTVAFLPRLCADGARVIWTRHRREPDLTVEIRGWFAEAGFEEVEFVAPEEAWFGVGAHRLKGPRAAFEPGVRLFTFVG